MTTPQPDLPDELVEPVPGPHVEPAEQLAHLVPAIWRTLRRASASEQELPANESQVTILRLVVRNGGATPAELSDALHVARPTVSNLLKGLVSDGLVARRTAQHDARLVTIVPTERGRTILETFRQDRTDALRTALVGLPAERPLDADALVAALRHLLHRLERQVEADGATDPAGAEDAAS
jgi:DNA-binding MarR family transcriptional regulator